MQVKAAQTIPSIPFKNKKRRKDWCLFLMMLPVLISFAVFSYAPMYGIIIAFKDYRVVDGIWGSKWVGFKHFDKFINGFYFDRLLGNTLKISLLRLVFGFPAPVLLAVLLNELQNVKFKRTVQTISYLPHFLSWVTLAGVFVNFLSPTSGALNSIIRMFGGEPIYFLGNKKYFVGTLIATGVWKGVGWGSIIYLAAITAINPELYESATIDGATRIQKIWYITIPSIAPTMCVLLILDTGGIMNAGFDQIFNLYSDAVLEVADIIDTYVYRYGLEKMEYSYSAAVGLFKTAINCVLLLTTNTIVKKLGGSTMF